MKLLEVPTCWPMNGPFTDLGPEGVVVLWIPCYSRKYFWKWCVKGVYITVMFTSTLYTVYFQLLCVLQPSFHTQVTHSRYLEGLSIIKIISRYGKTFSFAGLCEVKTDPLNKEPVIRKALSCRDNLIFYSRLRYVWILNFDWSFNQNHFTFGFILGVFVRLAGRLL